MTQDTFEYEGKKYVRIAVDEYNSYRCQGCAFDGDGWKTLACMKAIGCAWKEAPVESEPRKDDNGKIDTTLLFDDLPNALYAVAEVMQWASTDKKPTPYGRGSWKGVAIQRYRAAVTRHILDAAKKAQDNGEPIETQLDDESGLLHLAHQAASVLFQLELALKQKEQ